MTETGNFSKLNFIVLPNTFRSHFAVSNMSLGSYYKWPDICIPACKPNLSDIHSLGEFRQLQWNECEERNH